MNPFIQKLYENHKFTLNGTTTLDTILSKIKTSIKGYHKRQENNKSFFICLVGIYPVNHTVRDFNLSYPSNGFEYRIDIKANQLSLTYNECTKLLTEIIKLENTEQNKDTNKRNYFEEDNRMTKYLKTNNLTKESSYTIYYLKIKATDQLIKLFLPENRILLDDSFIEYILPTYNHFINETDIDLKCKYLYEIITMYKTRTTYKNDTNIKQEWIKSQGEFLALVSIIALIDKNIIINSKTITNPLTKRKLEIDFYISFDNNLNLAIEIDGKQHKTNTIQSNNDKIKDILLNSFNDKIKLIRIDWDENKKQLFLDNIYTNINSYFNDNNLTIAMNHTDFNILTENILKIVKFYKFGFDIDLNSDFYSKFKLELHNDLPNKIDNYIKTK